MNADQRRIETAVQKSGLLSCRFVSFVVDGLLWLRLGRAGSSAAIAMNDNEPRTDADKNLLRTYQTQEIFR